MPSSRKWIKYLILLVLFLAAATWFGFTRMKENGFDWEKFRAAMLSLDPGWFAIALLLIALTYAGRAIRWEAMIRTIAPQASFLRLCRAQVIGFTAVTLFGRPGELVRPYLIARSENVSFSSQLAVWFLERVFDLLAVLLIFGLSLNQLDPSTASHVSPNLAWVLRTGGQMAALLGAGACLFIVCLRLFSDATLRLLTRLLAWVPQSIAQRLSGLVEAFSHGIASTKSNTQMALVLLYTAIEWAIVVGAFYAVLHGFGPTSHLSLWDAIVVCGFVAFGGVVQIPGVGGGMQLVSFLVLTEIYGIGAESASLMAILLWLTTFVLVVPLGLALAFQDGLNWSKLRHLPSEAKSGPAAS
ncbi:MAG: flippase-like domain-containing protein [Bryobacteraceae bacterium]|nr:flippase-like domain-containing protein [Bryobacteraceae bacterium]